METSTDSAAMRSIPDAVAGGGAGCGGNNVQLSIPLV